MNKIIFYYGLIGWIALALFLYNICDASECRDVLLENLNDCVKSVDENYGPPVSGKLSMKIHCADEYFEKMLRCPEIMTDIYIDYDMILENLIKQTEIKS